MRFLCAAEGRTLRCPVIQSNQVVIGIDVAKAEFVAVSERATGVEVTGEGTYNEPDTGAPTCCYPTKNDESACEGE